MIRRMIAIVLVLALALSLTASIAYAARPAEKPWKTTPKDLPVLKLTGDHIP